MQTQGRYIISIILLLCLFTGCSEKTPDIALDFSDKDVISAKTAKPESININIFLDATTSMNGFAINATGVYNKFLDEIESSVAAGWKKADIHFYKFGTKIKEVDREGFKAAKFQPFYAEPGIYEKTSIDSVIDRMDSTQINVVITDLFQNDGDVNSIVLKIKEKCFANGIYLGIFAIKSDYDGMVFDAKVPPYPFKSAAGKEDTYRPFYVMVFGDPVNIEHFFDTLKSNPAAKEENFILISRNIINRYDVNLAKHPSSKDLTLRNKASRNQFNFSLKKDGTEGMIVADISSDRNTRTSGFQEERLELSALRKAVVSGQKEVPKDGVPTQDITLKELKHNGNKIQATLNLKLSEPAGTYSYLVYLQPSSIDGFMLPQWVKELSSDNPTPKKDANKTLNLEKFVSDLIRANSAVFQPKVAKFFITVKKL